MTPRKTDEDGTFSDEERAAMKERAAELRRGRGANKKEAEAKDCQDKIAALPDDERHIAERIHALVSENAPDLDPKTWYGMPAYARDGKVLCFFQPASKFDSRYSTFGFNDLATLDDGNVWPASFAVTKLDKSDEKFLAKLIKRAVG